MQEFWKGKRVLITGYEGFLGSHLTSKLLEKEAEIIGLDILTGRKETILSGSLKRLKVITASVEDFTAVMNAVKKNKIEFIFHLAASSLVGESYNEPLKAFSTNIRGTWNVLEAARLCPNIKGIIIASSDKAYGQASKLPYVESMPLCGLHPYDVSKSCADLLAHAYFHSYSLPVSVTRCGNIYGPGDFNFSRIVPEAMKSIFKKRTLFIRSNGKFLRDYIYVDDVLNGYLMLAAQMHKKKLCGQAFNFSNEDPITVVALVKKICKILGVKPHYRIMDEARYEIEKQYLSSAKARQRLGWRPNFSLERGLKITGDWYKRIFKER